MQPHVSTVSSRWQALDVARGVAIAAMIAYHFAWDLGLYQLTPVNLALLPAGKAVARTIAASFLFIVGVGLVLAHGRALRGRAFLMRFALVAGAALAVTVATVLVFPDSYVFFGILHCIALSSILALPFLRAPPWLTVVIAVACFAAPLVLTSPEFDRPLLAFLGLGSRTPDANDYVPLFPWFGFVLLGVAALRLVPGPAHDALARWRSRSRPVTALAWAGRRSLAIYLAHQPILLGALFLVARAIGPHPEAGASDFQRAYVANCQAAGGEPGTCERAAPCVLQGLRAENLWSAAQTGRFTPEHRARLTAISRECVADAQKAP